MFCLFKIVADDFDSPLFEIRKRRKVDDEFQSASLKADAYFQVEEEVEVDDEFLAFFEVGIGDPEGLSLRERRDC